MKILRHTDLFYLLPTISLYLERVYEENELIGIDLEFAWLNRTISITLY